MLKAWINIFSQNLIKNFKHRGKLKKKKTKNLTVNTHTCAT